MAGSKRKTNSVTAIWLEKELFPVNDFLLLARSQTVSSLSETRDEHALKPGASCDHEQCFQAQRAPRLHRKHWHMCAGWHSFPVSNRKWDLSYSASPHLPCRYNFPLLREFTSWGCSMLSWILSVGVRVSMTGDRSTLLTIWGCMEIFQLFSISFPCNCFPIMATVTVYV